MYNFDLVKVLYNYKKFRKEIDDITIKFDIYDDPYPDPNTLKVYDENNEWIGYMNLEEDKIYRWREPDWIFAGRVSDYV